MKKGFFLLVAVLIFILFLSVSLWAQPKKYIMEGKITAIDIPYKTVVIEVPMDGKNFTVAGPIKQGAILIKDGKKVSLGDFEIGDRVVVLWESTPQGHLIEKIEAK